MAILLKDSGRDYSLVRVVIGCSVMLGVAPLLLGSFWRMAKRKMYGRRLGILSLVFLSGLTLLRHFYRPSGPYKYYEYEDDAEPVGAAIFQMFLDGLFLLLILRLAFAKQVRAFFGGGVESA